MRRDLEKISITWFLNLVPERPSLENRELSPVPDIVSPTSPILAQSYHNQNTYSEPRNIGHRAMRQGEDKDSLSMISIFAYFKSPFLLGQLRARPWTGGGRGRWRVCTPPAPPWAATRGTRAGYPQPTQGPRPLRWPGACRSPSWGQRVWMRGSRLCFISSEAPGRGQ